MFITRVLTGACLTAVIFVVLAFSHIPWVLNTVIACMSVMGIYELYRATGVKNNKVICILSCFSAAVLCFIDIPYYSIVIAVLLVAAIILFCYFMKSIGNAEKINTGLSVLLACMIVCFFKTMGNIRNEEQGLFTLGLTIFVCIITDIMAYLVGKAIGKHKLAPVVSPKKTVEGSVGAIVCTTAIFLIVAYILDNTDVISVHYGKIAVYLIIASVVGQLGDLSLSTVKRIVKIKDYGKLLPGHGGILDRFDSLFLVAPVTYLFVCVAGGMFY